MTKFSDPPDGATVLDRSSPTIYKLRLQDCLVGAQMLFVAFGALVLGNWTEKIIQP